MNRQVESLTSETNESNGKNGTKPANGESGKKADESLIKELLSTIDYVEGILELQVGNGLLTSDEAKSFQTNLDQSREILLSGTNADLNRANSVVQNSIYQLFEKLNKNSRIQRWIYLYGIHIWAVSVSLTAIFLVLLVGQMLRFSIFQDVQADAMLWGGLGGLAFVFYHLRESVYKFNLSKYYAVYWISYPIAGMIFGLAVTIIASAGLFSLQAKPSYPVYAAIAFLAGIFQQWIISTLKDIAEAIHKSAQSASTGKSQ